MELSTTNPETALHVAPPLEAFDIESPMLAEVNVACAQAQAFLSAKQTLHIGSRENSF